MLILFIVIVPFTSITYLLVLHAIVVPFIMLHWYFNDNTCCLTLMEQKIREKIYNEPVDRNTCFMAKLINPIYDFRGNHEQFSDIIYIGTGILWLIGIFKLIGQYDSGQIKNWTDLFRTS